MDNLTFYIDKFIFTLCNQDLDLGFIPPNTRRRLNLLDKHTIYSINACISEKTQNIVFASQYGGFDRMLKLIGQYKETNEVSPTAFSASVHNYSCGQYTLLTQKTIPTLALAGRDNTFIDGLISAVALKQPLVYCFADYFGDIKTICFSVSPSKAPFKYVIKKFENDAGNDFQKVIELFEGKIKTVRIGKYQIESEADEQI